MSATAFFWSSDKSTCRFCLEPEELDIVVESGVDEDDLSPGES